MNTPHPQRPTTGELPRRFDPRVIAHANNIWTRLGRSRFVVFLGTLGPEMVAAIAGDDAGGIATYATVGAKYGYELLWSMVVITVLLAVVQEMVARLSATTGKGLSDLIREEFGVRTSAF